MRVAIISGSSRGLGKEIAIHFSKQNITPIITYNNDRKSGEAVLEECKKNNPLSTLIQLDISKRSSIKSVISKCSELFGRIDILINNAGINKRCDFYEITDDDWDQILTVNLKGPFIFCQEALQVMGAGSRIINISSVAGQYHGPKTVHYATSKAALNSLTKSVARYAAEKEIYVNAIAPGIILTDQTLDQFNSGDAMRIIEATQLLKRPGSIDEFLSTIDYLIDKRQTYLTGQVIALSGGAIIDN